MQLWWHNLIIGNCQQLKLSSTLQSPARNFPSNRAFEKWPPHLTLVANMSCPKKDMHAIGLRRDYLGSSILDHASMKALLQ
mmetsp:Transcript_28864/g.61510  ORF Transcript_28864/g.61510 Transcript_28864/m.61510 type:complete len:81 (+) Transcript_28864:35-277(+)